MAENSCIYARHGVKALGTLEYLADASTQNQFSEENNQFLAVVRFAQQPKRWPLSGISRGKPFQYFLSGKNQRQVQHMAQQAGYR